MVIFSVTPQIAKQTLDVIDEVQYMCEKKTDIVKYFECLHTTKNTWCIVKR